ncbi:uncharacterized protein LOC112565283 isoform X2 [Pomacea canaliculata]|uniref:uncharacterized protein LOC112565283 isoform X2 n=1 Tax=Pomacea canaliculata TaxID=400727 RepID=UPI000D737B64|nr:uncharacterized protein LOC112565283 isoform X2 [Pomacea canaliculata]
MRENSSPRAIFTKARRYNSALLRKLGRYLTTDKNTRMWSLFVLFLLALCLQVISFSAMYRYVYYSAAGKASPSAPHLCQEQSASRCETFGASRSSVEEILRWSGTDIPEGHPHWQRVDNASGAFVYSAHFQDQRADAIVKVVGIARHPLPYSRVWCRYFTSGHPVTPLYSVRGRMYHFRSPNKRRYLGAYVDCPVHAARHVVPYAVSVDKDQVVVRNNFLIIHYSDLHNLTASSCHDTDGGALGDRRCLHVRHEAGRGTYDKSDGHVTRWNVTRCTPALHNGFNNHTRLLEMVAVSTSLGVDHFVFYVESIGPDVSKALMALKRLGLAEVLPWNVHMEDEDLFYKGQFPAIQDCLYRHLHTSRYLLFGDVDEVFVPRSHASLLSLLDHYVTQNPACGAFLFLNTFFYLDFRTESPPASDTAAAQYVAHHRVDLLLHTRRQRRIFPPRVRSKPAVRPGRVETGSVHFIQKFRRNYTLCVVNKSDGLLHHYRYHGRFPSTRNTVVDSFLWRHVEKIVQELQRLTLTFNQTIELTESLEFISTSFKTENEQLTTQTRDV